MEKNKLKPINESKATLNAVSYEAITAALRPAAVVPAPP